MLRKALTIAMMIALLTGLPATCFGAEEAVKKGEVSETAPKAEINIEALRQQHYKGGIAAYIRSKNKKIGKKKSLTMAGHFIKYGRKYGVDPLALVAIGYHESKFKAKAKNPSGFYGVMQTSATIGKNAGYKPKQLLKPKNSIRAAAKYFKYNLKYFKGNYKKAFAGYCAGTGSARRGTYNKSVVNKRIKTRKKIEKFVNSYIDKRI